MNCIKWIFLANGIYILGGIYSLLYIYLSKIQDIYEANLELHQKIDKMQSHLVENTKMINMVIQQQNNTCDENKFVISDSFRALMNECPITESFLFKQTNMFENTNADEEVISIDNDADNDDEQKNGVDNTNEHEGNEMVADTDNNDCNSVNNLVEIIPDIDKEEPIKSDTVDTCNNDMNSVNNQDCMNESFNIVMNPDNANITEHTTLYDIIRYLSYKKDDTTRD